MPKTSSGSLELVVVWKTRISNNLLARVPITPNQEGTLDKREEVLSSVRPQDMDTSGYQVSDLQHVNLHWEDLERIWMQYPNQT